MTKTDTNQDKIVVDKVACDIRSILIEMAPNSPNDVEYKLIVESVVRKYLYRVVRYGADIDGRPFVQIEILN